MPSEYRDEFGHAIERRRSSDVDAQPEQTWYAAMAQWTQMLWWRDGPGIQADAQAEADSDEPLVAPFRSWIARAAPADTHQPTGRP